MIGYRSTIIVVFYLILTLVYETYSDLPSAICQEDREGSKSKGSRIEMKETVFDLGTVQYGEEITVTFKFRNVGDETLEIYDVESLSDDLYAVLSAKTFDPGDSGHIEVTMDTKGHVGVVVGRVSVITSDREHREIVLEVKSTVQPLLAFNPPFILGRTGCEGTFL